MSEETKNIKPIKQKNTASPRPTPPRKAAKVMKRKKYKPSPAKRQRVLAVMVLLLTMYTLLSLLLGGFLYFSFNKEPKNAQVYSLQLKYDGKRVYSFDKAEANNAYGLYVPFEKLSAICDLGIIGDSESVIILVRPDGGSIECKSNSSLIYVNDNAVRISSPVLFGPDDYLIPVELIKTYMMGIDVTFDDEAMLCVISRTSDSEDITLKMLLPTELEKTYFPDSYKTYQ